MHLNQSISAQKNCFLVSADTAALLRAVLISFLPVDHRLPLFRGPRALHKRLGFHFLRQGAPSLGVRAEVLNLAQESEGAAVFLHKNEQESNLSSVLG